jgi:hypothetical protein
MTPIVWTSCSGPYRRWICAGRAFGGCGSRSANVGSDSVAVAHSARHVFIFCRHHVRDMYITYSLSLAFRHLITQWFSFNYDAGHFMDLVRDADCFVRAIFE